MSKYTSQIVITIIIAVAFLIVTNKVWAHDHARPDLDDWFMTLKSRKGPCCGGPKVDATTLSDTQWRRKGDVFEVYVQDQWLDVSDEAVVYENNRAGVVLVWLGNSDGKPFVRCFMPGTLS